MRAGGPSQLWTEWGIQILVLASFAPQLFLLFLVPFWAPFLLLHLGGPDNITAYSLEDNSLWLRHLQTLTVQVIGAAYVIYKYSYVICGGTLLLLASLSMFVTGLVKYGERIWALKSVTSATVLCI
jgi:hypothetical protein